ncbi:hypothetical protein C4559_05595 [Candidatus Microgenomates bacterium]|nr:MAG: hypothetical protein C4559_05595 [Candidatus Microgenomates bacterium]
MKKKIIKIPAIGEKRRLIFVFIKSLIWFSVGVGLALFFFLSFIYLYFQKTFANVIYPGITINAVNFSNKTEKDVKNFFTQKNEKIADTKIVFKINNEIATVSAKQLNFGYDEDLLAKQAFSLGRSNDPISNASLILQAYINGLNLPPSYHYSDVELEKFLEPFIKKINVEPTEALFTFQTGKVSAFRPSADGQEIDMETLKSELKSKSLKIIPSEKSQIAIINIPVKTIKPKVSTNQANKLGIKELIGTGTSLFQHSIPNRIFNVTLASTRLNGILIAPDKTFSFNKALGDVSAFTGYQQAYIIQNGRTVLGDGGGVCQVSTTLFRAALDAGLPIMERSAHAYRVGYYEQDSGPGIDATVYGPTVDLKFKNDTGHYILIQTFIDPAFARLTFLLYGTKDGRQATIGKPVIVSQTPPLPTLYQDDPTLPKGVVKQVDFEAWGANVYFTREVVKDGKTIISDKFVSNYKPWQAIYLRGTKE